MPAPAKHHASCHRLFFAVRPPIVQARQIGHAALWLGAGHDGLKPEHLHVTMAILDDADSFPAAEAEAMTVAGGTIAAAPVQIIFDMAARSSRSMALRARRKNAALAALRSRIVDAMARQSLEQRHDYAFNPHMTLFYRDGAPGSRQITPVQWIADELLLIHSHVGLSRHDVLGRWPLTGAQDDQYTLL
jgi:2'-5' RNA ligase